MKTLEYKIREAEIIFESKVREFIVRVFILFIDSLVKTFIYVK